MKDLYEKILDLPKWQFYLVIFLVCFIIGQVYAQIFLV